MAYAEIQGNAVARVYEALPEVWKNITHPAALTNEQLADLTWAGHPGVRFYPCELPDAPDDGFEYTVTYSIDHAAKRVLAALTQAGRKVPGEITATQIRLWLVGTGISLASVDAAINSIPDAVLREQTRVQWEYAPYVERSHPLLEPLAAALGLTGEQLDVAFAEAAKL